ncbi:MAG TPA: ParB/RepB/Spo0J family partition protein [Gammaproteobacteria bacterium]|nr:ParB/RepB/Spo0J family partition protein [Gammaproteobacteria bacterium]
MAKRKALGRSFDTLLSSTAAPEAGDMLKPLPVDLIQRGKYQPRKDMHPDTLEELADSIRAQGVVQPIVVRPISAPASAGSNQVRYEIIAGERRWRAAQIAGLHDIPAVIRDVPDRAAIAMALIENIQRENLNPLEEARALERLIDEFDMTHQQASEAVGRSRASVSNLLRLLELTSATAKLVESGRLEMGHARALLALKGAQQDEAAREVAAKGLSVRDTEKLVRRLGEPKKPTPERRLDPDIRRLQEDLTERLGARVSVQTGPKGRGKLVINYTSLDELDGILGHIR